MNVKNYRQAQRYVDKLCADRDYVHDAYLRWYDKCGKDLFDETNGTVIRVLKYTILNAWEKGGYMVNGEKLRRSFVEIVDWDTTPRRVDSPEDIMVAHDLHDSVAVLLKDDYLMVFDMLAQDHRLVDIAEKMGVTPQYVGWLVKRIREIVVRHVGR
jgi:DNA-directed RNA polymerase specialized sigma24 family protein